MESKLVFSLVWKYLDPNDFSSCCCLSKKAYEEFSTLYPQAYLYFFPLCTSHVKKYSIAEWRKYFVERAAYQRETNRDWRSRAAAALSVAPTEESFKAIISSSYLPSNARDFFFKHTRIRPIEMFHVFLG